MSSNKIENPRVSVTRKLPEAIESRLSDLFETTLRTEDTSLNQAELKALISDCDVFVPTVTDDINADVIAAASKNLKLIANFGACLLYTSPSPRDA